MSDDTTARLALPFLAAGQAQKELTVNEALTRLDITVQAYAVAGDIDAPPEAPVIGACWIVGAAPLDAWSGNAGALAGWTGSGWRFVTPAEGMTIWVEADGLCWRWRGGTWQIGELAGHRVTIDGIGVVGAQAAAIADPTGGDMADAAARATVAQILVALRGHGLIAV